VILICTSPSNQYPAIVVLIVLANVGESAALCSVATTEASNFKIVVKAVLFLP